ncbi:MAG: hypothetical protein HOB14_01175 [Gammaproteobacteria bacterium]|nr:hypothetical protein [Gammaproteobacteria bacterium]MBT4449984.1 hypothetical protein [Gammaproteobacteria bacterium]MBT6455048.1 hypothetical protein [Gammaproteobacteria bacterium]MBT6700248.1 hypothetical protein [Gammaproteobacteria bacterium]
MIGTVFMECLIELESEKNGLLIAKDNGANTNVIELFSFLHDSMRFDDGHDQLHGLRASEFVSSLSCASFLDISIEERKNLILACKHHTDRNSKTTDKTILSCWDAG